MIFPNLIIAGAPKSGTTALFDYLKDHPQVCPASKKETYYLIDEGYPLFNSEFNYTLNGLSGYGRYFEHCDDAGGSILMEATPDYLYQQTPLQVIREKHIKPKIIILLRKPSARIYSMFQFARNNMATIDSSIGFSDYIDMVISGNPYLDSRILLKHALEQSRYEQYIPLWMQAAGEQNVKIYLFEDMIGNPRKFMATVATDLDIDPRYYDQYEFFKSNETYKVASQWLHRQMIRYQSAVANKALRKALRSIYYAINLRFGKNHKADADLQAINRLDEMFNGTSEYLEKVHNMDLSSWK